MRNRSIAVLLSILSAAAMCFAQQPSANASGEVSIVVKALRETVKAGSPVVVEVITKNETDHALSNSPWKNPWNAYVMDVRREDGNAVPDTEETQKLKESIGKPGLQGRSFDTVVLGTLEPGQEVSRRIEVSLYCDMSRPGKYSIQLAQNLALPNKPKVSGITSNTITVMVIP